MTIEVRPIRAEDIENFLATVDVVARERKYIARLDAQIAERIRRHERFPQPSRKEQNGARP